MKIIFGDEAFTFTLGLTEVEEHAWVSESNEYSHIEAGETGSYSTVDVYYRQAGICYSAS